MGFFIAERIGESYTIIGIGKTSQYDHSRTVTLELPGRTDAWLNQFAGAPYWLVSGTNCPTYELAREQSRSSQAAGYAGEIEEFRARPRNDRGVEMTTAQAFERAQLIGNAQRFIDATFQPHQHEVFPS